MRTREEDFVDHLFIASTHAYLMIFTDRGRVYWLKVHEIPDVGAAGKGKAIANLVSMEPGRGLPRSARCGVRRNGVHRDGHAARRRQEDAALRVRNPRAGGIIASASRRATRSSPSGISDGHGEILLATRDGKAIRFAEERRPPHGPHGLRRAGHPLRDGDASWPWRCCARAARS